MVSVQRRVMGWPRRRQGKAGARLITRQWRLLRQQVDDAEHSSSSLERTDRECITKRRRKIDTNSRRLHHASHVNAGAVLTTVFARLDLRDAVDRVPRQVFGTGRGGCRSLEATEPSEASGQASSRPRERDNGREVDPVTTRGDAEPKWSNPASETMIPGA